MKKLLLAGLVALFAFPSFAMAQVAPAADADVDTVEQSSCINISNNLRYRTRDASVNNEVSDLQDFLNMKGYLSSGPTGYFGLATFNAVKKFQKASGFAPTGYVGPLTREKIITLTCGGSDMTPPAKLQTSIPATTTQPQKVEIVVPSGKPSLPAGCTSTVGYSSLTGKRCLVPATPAPTPTSVPVGCTSTLGYSSMTGQKCDSTTEWTKEIAIPPTIASLSPTSGPVGKMVVVRGANFTGNETVYFGGYQVKAEKDYLVYATQAISGGGVAPAHFGGYIFNVPTLCPGTDTTCIPVSIANPNVYQVQVVNVNGKSNTVPFTVTTTTTTPSITVLSPNGGEAWTKGTTQTIKWQDSNPPSINCPVDATCATPIQFYDIKLSSDPMYSSVSPYTIAKNVSGSSYSWSVGKFDIFNTGIVGVTNTVSDGPYTIQVCQAGTTTCDSSDSYFKIVSSTSANTSPVINAIPAIPTDLSAGQTIALGWGATDADGDDLFWSVSWGDGSGVYPILGCAMFNPQNKQNWNYKASHAWEKSGTYTVKATVTDCKGTSNDYSLSVVVGVSITPVSSITVLSPNGGEAWTKGTTQTIKWQDSYTSSTCSTSVYYCSPESPRYYNVSLVIPPACTDTSGISCGQLSPSVVAKNVSGSSYNWSVGSISMGILGGVDTTTVPDGSYTIQVCQAGTTTCDSSDGEFKVVSGIGILPITQPTLQSQTQLAGLIGAFTQTSLPTPAPTSKLEYEWTRNLEVNSPYADDVSALQMTLTKEGVFSGEVTGGFYTQTYLAVKAFQAKYGIESTGFVGPQTLAKLNELY